MVNWMDVPDEDFLKIMHVVMEDVYLASKTRLHS